jgi:predicted RNA-binding Zn-ribbon protein involved in translation (DUF1610 family)
MARARRAASSASSGNSSGSGSEEFKCPECGRTFTRAAALGAHRKQTHGVAGTSAGSAAARKRRTGRTRTGASAGTRGASRTSQRGGARRSQSDGVNRDSLIAAIFPQGVPPKESVIREVSKWLDDAERLMKLR